ncbi:MAG: hypothetical protein CMH61_00715 [Nanoarchaeota archaeon]|nr:hypothetical protein [Nanoarchaeota archaeon]|tara:strand:- start:3032 stop:3247 length:216 start_codon:yes stop_codon:yes gene_type:complete
MGCGACKGCTGIMKIVFGGLILLNAFVWPKLSGIDGWITYFGILLVIGGLAMKFMPNKCKTCGTSAEMPKK